MLDIKKKMLYLHKRYNTKTDMAKLRGITDEMLTRADADIRQYEFIIKEGTQYEVAERLMKNNYRIIYCNYWNDADEKAGGQLTYSIDRQDIANMKRLF